LGICCVTSAHPVLEVLQYTSGRLRAQALHLRQDSSLKTAFRYQNIVIRGQRNKESSRVGDRVRLGSFFRLSGGQRFHNSLLKLSLCSFLPFGNWFRLTFFCSGVRDRRSADLIRKCPDFPRKSPDFPRFSPVFPRNPPDFHQDDLRLCGLRSQKSGLRWLRRSGRLFSRI
jgi:hypothetical protein